MSPNIGAMKDLLWSYGRTGRAIIKRIPTDRGIWLEGYYRDWAERQFGSEAAQSIAEIFAEQDWETLPHALEWTEEMTGDFYMVPGAILPNRRSWSFEQSNYAFVNELESIQSQIVGKGNRERFDYWLKAMQCLKIMGEYGCIRYQFEEACEAENWSEALNYRITLADLWSQLMTLMVEKATNASDLGEIINLETVNWKQLMINKWDEALENGLGESLPVSAYPSKNYTGSAFVRVTPARTQVYGGEPLELTVLIMDNPTSAKLYYRPLGNGSFSDITLNHVARGVYKVTIPPQIDDFEYYINAETSIGNAKYPVTAPDINQTVVVGPGVITRIESNNIIQEYELFQNYPNPFNASTIIKYTLQHNSDVKLAIYDILGREVIKLIDENQKVGSHRLIWDGRNKFGSKVASGVYIYRIIANRPNKEILFMKSYKMLLLK